MREPYYIICHHNQYLKYNNKKQLSWVDVWQEASHWSNYQEASNELYLIQKQRMWRGAELYRVEAGLCPINTFVLDEVMSYFSQRTTSDLIQAALDKLGTEQPRLLENLTSEFKEPVQSNQPHPTSLRKHHRRKLGKRK